MYLQRYELVMRRMFGKKMTKSSDHFESSIKHSTHDIHVHPFTDEPHRVWLDLVQKQNVTREHLKPLPLDTPIHPNKLR